MAKISKVVKNEERKKIVAQYAERRLELKKIINNPTSSVEEVDAAVMKLQKLPRNASPIRVRNRCSHSGSSEIKLVNFGCEKADDSGKLKSEPSQ